MVIEIIVKNVKIRKLNQVQKSINLKEFNYSWSIDHKIPMCTAKNESEVIILNHYTNLQPLCSRINMCMKRDRLDYK
jgi:hypothetical protein